MRARARQAKQNVNDVGRIVARVEMRNHSALLTLLVVEAVRADGMQRREHWPGLSSNALAGVVASRG